MYYIKRYSSKYINKHALDYAKSQRKKRWKDTEDRLILHRTQREKTEATSKQSKRERKNTDKAVMRRKKDKESKKKEIEES